MRDLAGTAVVSPRINVRERVAGEVRRRCGIVSMAGKTSSTGAVIPYSIMPQGIISTAAILSRIRVFQKGGYVGRLFDG